MDIENIIDVVTAWPIIIQGALGSGLFWLFITVTQWIFNKIQYSTLKVLSSSRRSALINERLRLCAKLAEGEMKITMVTALLYRMSRPLLKGLIWLVLGQIFASVIGVFSIVGYVGSIYYFFSAYNIIKAIHFDGDVKLRIEEIDKELDKNKT